MVTRVKRGPRAVPTLGRKNPNFSSKHMPTITEQPNITFWQRWSQTLLHGHLAEFDEGHSRFNHTKSTLLIEGNMPILVNMPHIFKLETLMMDTLTTCDP